MEKLHKFLESGHDLYLATLGTGDALWLPPATIVAERVRAGSDVVGIRRSWLYEECFAVLDAVSRIFGAQHQPWPLMNLALQTARAAANKKHVEDKQKDEKEEDMNGDGKEPEDQTSGKEAGEEACEREKTAIDDGSKVEG